MIAPPFVGRDRELPFVGRDDELEFLDRLTTASPPSITFVSGIGGIGKSSVLDAFARRRRAAGAVVVRIDCRLVEPTDAGFFRELRRAAGGDISSCEDAARRLGELGRVMLVLDEIDVLRLLDTREFDTFYYLVQRAGNVVEREEIITDVWGDDADVASNVVDVVVHSLRKKLAERANVTETISGIGYRLRDGEPANATGS